MKTMTILSFLFFLSFTIIHKHSNPIVIEGLVISDLAEPIVGANIFVDHSRKGGQTDSEGYFKIMAPPSVSFISIEHPAYHLKKIALSELGKPIVLQKRSLESKPSYSDREPSPSSPDLKHFSKFDKARKKSMIAEPAVFPTMSRSEVVEELVLEDSSIGSAEGISCMTNPDVKQEIKAGQLTAGEWNDLNNWKAWKELVEENDYKEMSDYWEMDKKERISVFISNQYELPIADCEVQLKKGSQVLWSAKSDNAGKAELWFSGSMDGLSLEVVSEENRFDTRNIKPFDKGVNHIQFKEVCNAPLKAEVMFVVDATGSMGDEIDFLKSELKDVIDQVESERTDIDFSWGSVFYRDQSDEYLTKQTALSSKSKRTLDFISMQSAGGGGDYPEAVNEGLEEALMQEWSEHAIARIIFLLLDAPPHHTPEVISELQSQIEFAASMGIKIIPITASGINRQTEYLMKFMSIMTNGTYVFLTDHSGIGNKHLDPIVKDFEVEKLNDLLIRLVKNYTDPGTCVNQENSDPVMAKVEVYPNPTIDKIKVKVPEDVKKITLSTSSGMLISSAIIHDQEFVDFDLSDYVDGLYIVSLYTEDEVYNQKVIKSNRA